MRKIIIINCAFLFSVFYAVELQAQSPSEPNININAGLPTIIGPSPAVASLMRFEEVPVNQYTGIPQIDIPIFSTNTLGSKINVNIGLSYHPSSINADEIAPLTGLGWNLMAGGVISRTVRGLPDEYWEAGSSNPKAGIYQTNQGNNSNYYHIMERILNGGPDSGWEDEEFKWDAYEHGKYDTQHDLYQFDFMGRSGRFIIKKDLQNNELNAVPLDNNTNYHIDVIYNQSDYIISAFNILDENGIKYVFDTAEFTSNHSSSQIIYANGDEAILSSPSQEYNSAYHLSRIYDPFENLIVSFKYDPYDQRFSTSSKTENFPPQDYNFAALRIRSGSHYLRNIHKMKPASSLAFNQREVKSSFLKSIEVVGVAKIEFFSDDEREDSNLPTNSGAKTLTKVLVEDWAGELVKKITFHYDYFQVPYPRANNPLKRLILSEVRDYGRLLENPHIQNYLLFYKHMSLNEKVVKDPWGFFALEPGYSNHHLEVEYATVGVLEEMLLPTGGKIRYEFEPSTYSFIGDVPLTEFNDNPLNETYVETWGYMLYCDGALGPHEETFYPQEGVGDADRVVLEIDKTNLGDNFLRLKGTSPGQPDIYPDCFCLPNEDICVVSLPLENGYTYKLVVVNQNRGATFTVDFTAIFFKKRSNPLKYNFGGGIRIKSIGFYENGGDLEPATKKSYNYSLLFDRSKSSGALVFPKPLFEYGSIIEHHFTAPSGSFEHNWIESIKYQTKTNFNNLAYLKTHGTNVGYKNVTVTTLEQRNSFQRTEYTYLSPIDSPETSDDSNGFDAYVLNYPFLPPKNLDYKRGHLKNISVFNSTNKKVRETENYYDFSHENVEMSGILLSLNFDNQCPYAYKYKFDYYKYLWLEGTNDELICNNFPASHIQPLPIMEAAGWAKLSKRTITDYLNLGIGVTTTTEFAYNQTNKQIHSKKVWTSNLGEAEITKYLYPTDLPDEPYMTELITANRIVEPIEVRKILEKNGNEILLQTTRAQFDLFVNPNNQRYLPKIIHTLKGGSEPVQTSAMEPRLVYHDYDSYGNPRDISQEGGTRISYIWGYRGLYPVAKIENATYAQASNSNLGLNFNKINNPSSSEELQMELWKIRNGLPHTMVTTYSYKPLIGISKIIDPKGEVISYEYDDFGRLMLTRDTNGFILSDTEYSYRER